MIDISIIMISYNTCELTLNSLQSLVTQTRNVTYEVVVLDNNSSDGSATAIAEAFPNVRLIKSKTNLGFAGGNNVAAKQVQGEYILLLNPDTVVMNGAIQKLIAFARENQSAQIWGGKSIFPDGSLNPASCWKKITLWSIFCSAFMLTYVFPKSSVFNPEGYGGWNRDSVKNVDIVSGCFFLIKNDFWKKLDGFAPDFFMYGEEADLCLRARKFGANPMVTPDAEIIHYGGASETVREGKMIRLLTAKVKLIRKHWPSIMVPTGVILYKLLPLIRLFGFGLLILSGEKSAKKNFDIWMVIWKNRTKWLQGVWDG